MIKRNGVFARNSKKAALLLFETVFGNKPRAKGERKREERFLACARIIYIFAQTPSPRIHCLSRAYPAIISILFERRARRDSMQPEENRLNSLARTDESAILLTEVATMLGNDSFAARIAAVNAVVMVVVHDSPRQKSAPLRKQLTFVLMLIYRVKVYRAFHECYTRERASTAAA